MDVLAYVKEKAQLSTLLLPVGTVFAGTACAAIRGNLEWFSASLCLIFALFLQLGTNLYYQYRVSQRAYDGKPHPRYQNREDAMNELDRRVLREGSFACFVLAAMVGLVIMGCSPRPMSVFGAGIVVALVTAYICLRRKAFFGTFRSLIITWFAFGPIGVIFTGFVEMEQVAMNPWVFFDHAPCIFVAPAIGLLACNVYLLYSYLIYHITPNPAGGITHKIGPKMVQVLIFVNGLVMLGVIFVGVFAFNFLKPLYSCVPAFMSFALNTFLAIRIGKAPLGELRYLNLLCKLNFAVTGVALLLFWEYAGYPSASMLDII